MAFDLKQFANPEALARAAASAWLDQIDVANRTNAQHSVALSGGRITQRFFASVVEQANTRATAFERVHFFWADERCLLPTDSESNFRMADELLFQPLGINAAQIHRIRGEDAPEAAAESAAQEIAKTVSIQNGQPVLDLVLLGLGEDAHVASLFPDESKDVSASPAIYRAVLNSPKPPSARVTLGYPAIGAAKAVWMLASGKGKETALRNSLHEGHTPFGQVLHQRAFTQIFSDITL
jgi:6-phosphogluconolactonase